MYRSFLIMVFCIKCQAGDKSCFDHLFENMLAKEDWCIFKIFSVIHMFYLMLFFCLSLPQCSPMSLSYIGCVSNAWLQWPKLCLLITWTKTAHLRQREKYPWTQI